MSSNLERYKKDLEALVERGGHMQLDLIMRAKEEQGQLNKKFQEAKDKLEIHFEKHYQRWYTESCALIRQLIPNRLDEFVTLYKGDGKRKAVDGDTYHVQDWLNGVRSGTNQLNYNKKYFDDLGTMSMRFNTQLEILKAVQARFESSLFDIKQLVQADMLDSELDAARELLNNGYMRGAGVIAGVVLESHLSQVATNHALVVKKKNPAISDFNDLLKENTVMDVPEWRFVQRLGDLRNLCGHNKGREPSKEEVSELIEGVSKVTKTLY